MPDPKISWASCLGGCEIRIAGQAPSPGGNLPSNRYLTREFLLPTACYFVSLIVAFCEKKARGNLHFPSCVFVIDASRTFSGNREIESCRCVALARERPKSLPLE